MPGDVQGDREQLLASAERGGDGVVAGRRPRRRMAFALAGAVAAALWAVQQPIDKRLSGSGYDDVEFLGKAVTRGRGWRPIGFAMHVANGALFGLAYSALWRRTPGIDSRLSAHVAVQAENFGLFPLTALSDRLHPAVVDGEIPRLSGSRRALAQATWRHAILGVVLGEVGRRLDPAVQERRHAPWNLAAGADTPQNQ